MTIVSQTPKRVKEWRLMRDLQLGVPAMRGEREEFWRCQTEIWRPWMQAVSEHAWSFLEESPCLNCGQLTTCIQAGKYDQTLCPECLNMGSPDYPTGWSMLDGTTYVRHSEMCTSHSSYPTSSSSMRSEEASLPSLTPNTKASSPTSTSSSVPQIQTRNPSLRAMRLSRSDS